ncbi:hypothetical protein IJ182_00570 [bacterium]|nr:hypothetical protein [bacterium]
MNISAISATTPSRVNSSFKAAEEKKPLVKLTAETPDDAVVCYSTWGDNYAFPVTAGQIREAQRHEQESLQELRRQAAADRAAQKQKETPDEYTQRKLYSTEWCM